MRRWIGFVLLALSLAVSSPAAMGQALKYIYGNGAGTGSATVWGTSGTATAANTDFNTLTSSGSLSFVAASASQLWQSAFAPSYIEATTGASITFRVDPTSGASGLFGAAPAGVATVGAWVYAELVDTTLAGYAAPGAATTFIQEYLVGTIFPAWDGGTAPSISALCYVIRGHSVENSGILILPYNSTGNLSTLVANGFNATSGTAWQRTGGGFRETSTDASIVNSELRPNIPFNQWVYIARKFLVGANGYGATFINGQMVSYQQKTSTTTVDANANNVSFFLPAITGVKWRLGEANSHRGTGHPWIDFKKSVAANSTLLAHWPVTFANASPTEGQLWTTGGTAAAVGVRNTSNLGFNDRRERVVAHMAAAETFTLTATRDYGTLDYNAEGWAWVWFPHVLLSDVTGKIVVKNTSGTAVAGVQFDQTGLWRTLGTADVAAIDGGRAMPIGSTTPGVDAAGLGDGPAACSVGFAFNSDGRVHVLVLDNTANSVTVSQSAKSTKNPTLFSAPLDNWTPAAIGDLLVSVTSNNRTTFECGGAAFYRYLPLAAMDSYSEGPHWGITFDYITWGTTVGSPTITAGTTVLTHSNGVTTTLIQGDVPNRWAVGVTAGSRWPNESSTLTSSTGTSSPGMQTAVASKCVYIGTGAVTGTFARNETITGGTSGATAKLVMSGLLDSLYISKNTLVLGGITGTFRHGETLTGGTSGATTTANLPVIGRDQAAMLNGDSVVVYGALQDAFAATNYTPYMPTQTTEWGLHFAGTIGRAGRVWEQFVQGSGGMAHCPALAVYAFGGIANSCTRATTLALALEEGNEAAEGLAVTAATVTGNDGLFFWELPTFGSTGGFTTTFARDCFNQYINESNMRLGRLDRYERVRIINPGAPAFADGTHYSFPGAVTAAARQQTVRGLPRPGNLRGRGK